MMSMALITWSRSFLIVGQVQRLVRQFNNPLIQEGPGATGFPCYGTPYNYWYSFSVIIVLDCIDLVLFSIFMISVAFI